MALRIAIVGLGVISRYYLGALPRVPEVELAAVCDRDPSRTGGIGVPADRDWARTLERDDVEAVVVNLPNDLHAAACADALEAGRHVCCEKPLTLDPADAERLAALARRRGLTLFTAFHRRYNSNLGAALAELRAGAAVVRARARYHERIAEHAGDDAWYLDPRRCGGGCLADNGPNAIDALRHALGPLRVTAAEVERDARGVDLQARVELVAEGGVPATVELDWDYPDGELKDVELELADGRTLRANLLAGFPGFKSSLHHEYEGVLRDFAARVRSGGGDTPDEGIEAVRLVAAAYRLARTGERAAAGLVP